MSSNDPEDLSKATIDLTKTSSSDLIPASQPSQTPPSSTHCSPKSGGDNIKSPSDGSGSKNRRKRKPKKVSTSLMDTSISDNEPMDIDLELTNKVSSESVISVNSEVSKPESDCETIEKIAKMVSNITNEEKPAEADKSTEEQEDNVINDVEKSLEELFADAPESNVKEQVTTESTSVEDIPKDKPTPAKPKPIKRKRSDAGANKRKNVNGNKSKDKKNDKSGKSKGGDKNKVDKQDSKKAQKSKENGGRSKVKIDAAPYVQIQKDGSFTVVNQTSNGDDDTDKPSSKAKKPVTMEKHRQHIRGLHVSTLSNKYDADKRDTTWICVFCKLGPHKNKLGDLFGPYIISKKSEEYSLCLEDPANDIFRQSNRDKFIPIKSPVNTPKKKKKAEVIPKKVTSPTAVNGPEISEEVFTGMTAVDENNYEIWFHEDCIVWSPGTHIIGTKIIGLEAAVWQSTRHRCEYCQKNGAMIACLTRGCLKEAHIVCASKSWKLCEDFKTFCDLHST
ncbi:uncharacterized protein CG5098 [Chironomus tepperi]|uniref:uncharacterized protein CG5098 n=1 Tax=Chironomus tepperi TaxID=113505 RepID=UPI00391F12D2